MFLMFGDEADREQGKGKKFFVYGAIFIDTNCIPALHNHIQKLRNEAGLAATDSLKFAGATRPKDMLLEAHRDLKNKVMRAAEEIGHVKFCAQVTLHDLARNQVHDDLVLWGANTVLGRFNRFLIEQNEYGYVLFDRIPVQNPYRARFMFANAGLYCAQRRSVKPSIRKNMMHL
jgi:hypothetical protein